MRRSRRIPRSRALALPLAAAALMVSGLIAAPASSAEEHEEHGATSEAASQLAEVRAAAAGAGTAAADGVDKSANLRLLANLPKQAPFDTEASFGTDIAFQDDYAYVGNYDGFVVYDISQPRKPEIVTQVLCPGAQNDISVYDDILVLSTDSSRNDDSCSSVAQPATVADSWEGVKVFDISDPAAPRYVAAVETDCGSHTHTLVPDKTGDSVYAYVSSYSPRSTFPDCQPPHDKISVVEIPLDSPADSTLASTPVLFPDGGNPGTSYTSATTGCHDITAYPEKDIAAGACMGEGVLMDISDPAAPRVIETVLDNENFAFWHSATFNNAGTKVVFTDELGGGGSATCNPEIGPERGADGIYDITGTGDDRTLEFASYFKIPREQSDTENCVAHNGSLIPVKGRDIMVQAWYQGGISVWDFTDSANPVELGHFDRPALSEEELILGGSWSAYYYNGYIYSSDIQLGLDVLEIRDPKTNNAKRVKIDQLNVQSQTSYRD